MAENFVLKMILDGISALETKDELEVMRNAVNDHLTEFPQRPLRFLTEAEIVALAKGNSEDMIRVNKEKYDYSGVRVKDLPKAEKWFMAHPPSWKTHQEYYQWRVWNVAKTKEGKDIKNYKGGLIVEKATGKSVPPPAEIEPESPEWESEESEEEEDEEVTVAMAAVRVE
jgi:hypothetical protein